MKKIRIIALFFLSAFIIGCSSEQKENDYTEKTAVADKFPDRAKAMNIYEVNVRQYTPKGTFKAFEAHLPRLKEMGVDILWLMPITPIGEKERKGGLGSYYSVKDYTAVNPEFGTLEDFKELVRKVHEMDMLIILDWVANHTAWDHAWITEKPYYYTKDAEGNMHPPVPDWTDVADLNYDNEDMRKEMIAALKWWVAETDIDGYRCDVASSVPMDFWNAAKKKLDAVKDVFMLAEADEPEMHADAFHATYGWEFHHIMNQIAKGELTANAIDEFLEKDSKRYPANAFRLNFTTNHDENSWNGTVFERYGEGHLAFATLAFTVQGMPLVYSGQEAGLNWRLRFFDKDTIKWDNIAHEAFYTSLLKLKKENKALWSGAAGGTVKRINTDNKEKVYAFQREKDGNTVTVMLNLSGEEQQTQLEGISGELKDVISDASVTISEGSVSLPAWAHYIFVENAE